MSFPLNLRLIDQLINDKRVRSYHCLLILNELYLMRNPISTQALRDRIYGDHYIGSKIPSLRSFQEYVKYLVEKDFITKTEGHKNLLTRHEWLYGVYELDKMKLKLIDAWRPLLEKYKGMPVVDDLLAVVDHNYEEFLQSKNSTPKILPEGTENQNVELLNELYLAIDEETKINFRYKKFDSPQKKPVSQFMPYLLKQHKKRWYVVGKSVIGGPFIIYALDRISDYRFDNQEDPFEREPLNVESLWQYSMGIYTSWKQSDNKDTSSEPETKEPVLVSFKVKDGEKFNNVSYLKTAKIHPSQSEPGAPDKDGWAIITMTVFPDTDLVREIRRIGLHCVKDIQPAFLDNWVRKL